MKIVFIFKVQNQSLYSVKENDSNFDEFDKVFDLWQDVEYLENFFYKNEADLSSFYSISVEDAVRQTLHDAKEFQKRILGIKDSNGLGGGMLSSYFRPLDKIFKRGIYEKCKAYGTIDVGWLRLYAVKIPENCYVITGGAIKLTKKMNEREHTQEQLQKLINCIDYLRSVGIVDDEGIIDI